MTPGDIDVALADVADLHAALLGLRLQIVRFNEELVVLGDKGMFLPVGTRDLGLRLKEKRLRLLLVFL